MLIFKPTQFQIDLARVMFSLTYRTTEWSYATHYRIRNESDHTVVWLGTGYAGMDFTVEGRNYGGVTIPSMIFGAFIPWRRKLRKCAEAAMASGYMRGLADRLSDVLNQTLKNRYGQMVALLNQSNSLLQSVSTNQKGKP